jgi:hypothetical protein
MQTTYADLFKIFHMIALLSKMQRKEVSTPTFGVMAEKHRAVRALNDTGGG